MEKDNRLTIIADKGLHIPDPYRGYTPIPTGVPVKVKKSTYWNRRIKQGDVKIFIEEVKKKPVKKVEKKTEKSKQE